MDVKKTGTARLEQLIKASGQPEAVTLWTKPEDNPQFMRAVKERRVLTVLQQNVGTKKDYGLVGFFPKDLAAFWIFPKPLKLPDETKVIGIKYERLAPSKPKGPLYKPKKKERPPGIPLKGGSQKPKTSSAKDNGDVKKTKAPKPAPAPKEFTFRSTAEITATQRVDLEVKAASTTQAAKILKSQAEEITVDPAKADVSRKLSKPKKLSK
jgi:hypothetical protein